MKIQSSKSKGLQKFVLRRKLLLSFAMIASVFVGARLAFAGDYLGTGKFSTGNLSRCHSGAWYTPSQNASANWSSATNLNISYSCSSYQVTTLAANYGSTGWGGQAVICNSSGACNTFNDTYSTCTAKLNTSTNYDTTTQQKTALHELGHCWSLDHRNDATSAVGGGATYPNATDISLVNARY
jgi:hypothetical protein